MSKIGQTEIWWKMYFQQSMKEEEKVFENRFSDSVFRVKNSLGKTTKTNIQTFLVYCNNFGSFKYRTGLSNCAEFFLVCAAF